MSSFLAHVIDIAVWLALIACVYAAVWFASTRIFAKADSHRLVAVLVTLGLAIGVVWPFSTRLAGPVRVTQAGGGGRPAIGDTIADGPCAGTLSGAGVGSIDGITVDPTGGASATGWAAAADKSGPATAVCAILDDTVLTAPVQYGGARPDVAKAFGNAALANAGYAVTIPMSALDSGTHALTVVAKSGDVVTIVATQDFEVP